MPYKKSPASFMKHKSKAVGYMVEGSAAHMNSAVKKTNLDEFGNPIPKDFKADAPGVTGIVRKVTSEPIAFGDHGYGIGNPQVRDVEGKIIKEAGRDLRDMQDPKASRPNYKGLIPSEELKGKTYITTSIDNRGIGQMSPYKMHGDPDTPHTDPELTKKEGKAKKSVSTSGDTTTTTTTQRMSGIGKTGGFTSGTGYDLDEVIVGLDTDSSSTTNAQPKRKKKKRKTYSKAGNFLRGINPLSTKYERVRARTRLGQDRLL